ncbi:nitroreductase family protein [Sporolactobacillus shoreicorticis]|uniref:Acg family FMN-binding oxidoreductase n=1 Tax=Sporolactobacillus shoreicorticis TaxID=1923877 RepID=A0ABW5S311_9BACL|nr:nitroreductase family protein [Sporolactobacillus shoreicorticis]MCO7125298.1 nitroreductase family protein [Sporolactobacillus shoreicorticis]
MKRKGVKKVIIISIASFITLIFLALAAILLTGGLFQSQTYLQPWDKSYANRFKDPRIRLAAYGLLAANGHNMQPWIIKLDKNDPNTFYLFADANRMSPQADPEARQLMVTQGTFLDYVAVAGRSIGYPATISLFPGGTYNEQQLAQSMSAKPVAKITLKRAKPQQSPLFNAIYIPDTNRETYKSAKLTAAQIDALETLSENKFETKIYQDKADVKKLGKFALNSVKIEAGTRRVMDEAEAIFRANESQKNKKRYGFSFEGQGTSGFRLYFMQGLITLFPSLNNTKASSDLMIQSTQAAIDHTPAYAMISSDDNSRASQVKSGMIYSRLTLTAASLGLAVQPVSQALEEYPEMNKQYTGIHRSYAPKGQTIQMLVRIGTPTKTVPQSMRRDVMELVHN